ncbi:MAG: pyridoxal-dependent decarboxylase, partial [Paracoccaceae bacterium]
MRNRPVRAPSAKLFTSAPPLSSEPIYMIFADIERIVPNGMTHWQHPRFFVNFPANAAPESMLAEQFCNAIAAQGIIWQTSPAATEMEEVMISWSAQALGLPAHFKGTIHDSATTATLAAVLAVREAAFNWQGLNQGLSEKKRLRIYISTQAHSSVDKVVKVVGIGPDDLVKIQTDQNFSICL